MTRRPPSVDPNRRPLLIVAALLTAGTALELALERHWGSAVRLIPWFAVAALAVGTGTLALGTQARGGVVRVLGAGVILASVVGVFEHVQENYKSGPLDRHYSTTWATMSIAARWWAAATKSVGPAPVLAPGMLAVAAVCVLFASATPVGSEPPANVGGRADVSRDAG